RDGDQRPAGGEPAAGHLARHARRRRGAHAHVSRPLPQLPRRPRPPPERRLSAAAENEGPPIAVARPWIGPHGRPIEWLELHLTYTCPERCVFCSEAHRMAQFSRFPVTFARVATVLRTHAARGV